jgi:hypothetical protein
MNRLSETIATRPGPRLKLSCNGFDMLVSHKQLDCLWGLRLAVSIRPDLIVHRA